MAKNADGSLVTGSVLGRIVNRSGNDSQPLNVMGNPVPYLAGDARYEQGDAGHAYARNARRQDQCRQRRYQVPIGPSRIAMRRTRSRARPTTSTLRNCRRICRCTSVSRTASIRSCSTRSSIRPRARTLLGVGIAAFRDVNSFFRYEAADTARHAQSASPERSNGRRSAAFRNPVISRVSTSTRDSIRTSRTGSCTKARGRSSPAVASRPTCAGVSPTACSNSTSWAAKVRNGGWTGPIPCAACRRKAFWIAAARPVPARRSSSISAAPKSMR